jgi:hypothetical protein
MGQAASELQHVANQLAGLGPEEQKFLNVRWARGRAALRTRRCCTRVLVLSAIHGYAWSHDSAKPMLL